MALITDLSPLERGGPGGRDFDDQKICELVGFPKVSQRYHARQLDGFVVGLAVVHDPPVEDLTSFLIAGISKR